MPIAKNLTKVQKKVAGQESAIHPRARKFKQLNKATLRQQKLTKQKATRDDVKQGQILRVRFFKDAVDMEPEKDTFTVAEIQKMIDAFISRDDDELEKLKAARRPGRPASSRQDQIQARIHAERKEYKSGYKCPDLTDAQTVDRLRTWSGTAGGLNVFKFVRITPDSDQTTIASEAMET